MKLVLLFIYILFIVTGMCTTAIVEHKDIKFMFYNSFFGKKKPEGILTECMICDKHISHPLAHTLNITLRGTNQLTQHADLLVVHIPNYQGGLDAKKDTAYKNIPWAVVYQESPTHYPKLSDSTFMSQFQYRLSYRTDSTGHFSYFPKYETLFNHWPGMKTKNASSPVIWISRNCNTNNNRTGFVKELMKYINIDSYGSCAHTTNFPPSLSPTAAKRNTGLYSTEIINFISNYKFYLAFENSNCIDYVTEKYWRSINAGAVPIVIGAPNIDKFSLTERSMIKVSDYNYNAKELAEYLLYLDKNDDEYRTYLSYKYDRSKVLPEFTMMYDNVKKDGWCETACTVAIDQTLGLHPKKRMLEADICES